MSEDLVSVIMPAFRSAEYISESIKSVLQQSYPHWELLIVNDCSPDNLEDVVLTFSKSDSRIRYFCLAKNSGPAAARNEAIKHSKGRFLAFLDSDDCWEPQKLERQLAFMKNSNYAFTFTEYHRMRPDGVLYPFNNTCPSVIDYQSLLKDTCIATLTVILDRGMVGDVKLAEGWGYDDFVLWLDILKRGFRAHCLKENLAQYRVMDTSVSSNKIRAAKWVWNIYRHHEHLDLMSSCINLICYSINAFLKRFSLSKRFKIQV